MDWFHCNRCFRQEGAAFSVTSCGHVLCSGCGGTGAAGSCPVCAASCRRLALSRQLRPEEQLFFRSPAAMARRRLAQLAQAGRFQRGQWELQREETRRLRQQLGQARRRIGDAHRELEALRQEISELRRAQLSPSWRGGSRSVAPRPVGVTSPAYSVAPQPRRQLSGQVVSRSQDPPLWQGLLTPLSSSAAQSPGSAHRAPPAPLWSPWPPLPAAIFPPEATPPGHAPRR